MPRTPASAPAKTSLAAPPDIAPTGNFSNPAFILSLVPALAAVLTLFHSPLGLTLSANSEAFAILAAGIVSVGAYLSRAMKHRAHGDAWAAYYAYLAQVQSLEAPPTPVDDPATDDTASGEALVDPTRIRAGSLHTTRSAAGHGKGSHH